MGQGNWRDRTGKRLKCSMFSLSLSLPVKPAFGNPRPLKPEGKVWSKENLPLVKEDKVREHLNKLDVQKPMMGPDGLYPCKGAG